MIRLVVSMLSVCLVAGCGGDDGTCDPVAQAGCDDGFVCEQVAEGEPACFRPVLVRGSVFDLTDDGAIEGAHVVALDVNGASTSSVAITDGDGNYELAIPSTRDAEGAPAPLELTLRASGAGYQTFPSGVRQALPIDTASSTSTDAGLIVQSALTEIGLLPVVAGSGTGSISGTVEVPPNGAGVLVVAETSSGTGAVTGHVAVVSREGEYRIFNVPAGSYAVVGYAQGVNYEMASAEVTEGADTVVDLGLNDVATGTVTGTVQIVNAPGGSKTSVILVVESTFDDVIERGQTVPGLRDPAPGIAVNIDGTYTITGVPVGRYVALAAFENDSLVRDPDTSIGGTSTLHIEVTAGATTTVEGFKVTEALEIFAPGATAAEEVTGAPTFRFADDSSEDEYFIEVFDSFGTLVWDTSIVGQSADPSVLYEGPALQAGMYYQFRATSIKDTVPLSRTEDLRGVFFMP